MPSATSLSFVWKSITIVAVMACWFSAFPAVAQQGQDAVFNSSGQVTNSPSFIDASQFAGKVTSPNFCSVLNYVLVQVVVPPTYPSGAVIDARGLANSTPPTSMTCAAGTTPWNNGSATVSVPSTILLPAATITIPVTWALPSNTKLIGAGYGTTGGTVIRACTTSTCPANFPTGSSMIQFGLFSCPINTPICYSGISVENLMLNGSSENINGIQNSEAQSSYADHVVLFQIMGTGLSMSAMNSGPYTNITFDSGSSALSTTTCANITGSNGTFGIHGLTCIAGSAANAAVYLDAPNTSIEDARIAGFYDGILVGSQASTQSDVLFNIFSDSSLPLSSTTVNVVHISNAHTVTHFSIMGVNNPVSGNNSIKDELTSTTLSDSYVAMYVVGKATNGGYSRFTTSPHAATWAVSASAPLSGSTCAPGSLYSNTSANPAALYVCSVSTSQWLAVK